MARQSISFTAPNEAWLKEQVDSEENLSRDEILAKAKATLDNDAEL